VSKPFEEDVSENSSQAAGHKRNSWWLEARYRWRMRSHRLSEGTRVKRILTTKQLEGVTYAYTRRC